MKILIADPISPEGLDYLRSLDDVEALDRAGISPEELASEMAEVTGLLVRSRTRVTAQVIEGAPRLKVIGRAGAGVDNIDLKAATRRGIVVMNTPGGNSVSVAEHTLALMLALARRIPEAHASLSRGEWKKSALTGAELRHKTLGVVGLGKIGAVVARLGKAFGMNVMAFDPFISEGFVRDLGVELVDLETLLAQSDFVTLHLPSNPETQGLINSSTLELMKREAFLINAARGTLIVEADLLQALNEDRIAGAALDVFLNEPKIDSRMLRNPKLVLTPHIAGATREAQAQVGIDIAAQTVDYLRHGIIRNAVNFPSVSPEELEELAPYLRLGERLGTLAGRLCRFRYSQVGIRYYGEPGRLNYKPISNRILQAVLRQALTEEVNDVNARSRAEERGIELIETVSSRRRSHSNLISLQLRDGERNEWVEGAVLHQGRLYLVSVDDIAVEARLGDRILLIRNQDKPGVIGRVGTLLGEAEINIASFVLGRGPESAVGVVNVDSPVSEDVLSRIREIPEVVLAESISF